MSGGTFQRHERLGRYEVREWLGSGSFAAVYLAYDPALDVTVAVKVLGDHHSSDPDVRARFIQEARMLRRAANDRIVTVRDIGEVDGQPYFVMDAFARGNLADRLAAETATPRIESVRHLVNEIALCLTAVHDAGLIHRDLKPSNLLISGSDDEASAGSAGGLLSATERLVLGDFGVAKDAEATGLTMGAGTHGFMAPEQLGSLTSIDSRVDIYAATAIVQLVLQKLWGDLPMPAPVVAALETGMATEPNDRPPTSEAWAAMMLDALGPATESGGSSASAVPVAVGGDGKRDSAASRLVAALGGAALALLVVAGVWALNSRGADDQSQADSQTDVTADVETGDEDTPDPQPTTAPVESADTAAEAADSDTDAPVDTAEVLTAGNPDLDLPVFADASRRGQPIPIRDETGVAVDRVEGTFVGGETQIYTFDVVAGQSVLVRQTGGCEFTGDTRLDGYIAGPLGVSGRSQFDIRIDDCRDAERYDARQSGEVTFTIDEPDPEFSGSFSFEVIDVTNEPVVQLALGDRVDPNSPVPGAGVFEFPGSVDVYSFEVAAGDNYLINQLGCEFDATTRAYLNFDGAGSGSFRYNASNCEDTRKFVAAETGIVLIYAAADADHQGTGTYSFELVPLGR